MVFFSPIDATSLDWKMVLLDFRRPRRFMSQIYQENWASYGLGRHPLKSVGSPNQVLLYDTMGIIVFWII